MRLVDQWVQLSSDRGLTQVREHRSFGDGGFRLGSRPRHGWLVSCAPGAHGRRPGLAVAGRDAGLLTRAGELATE